jgi:hypothetical protein
LQVPTFILCNTNKPEHDQASASCSSPSYGGVLLPKFTVSPAFGRLGPGSAGQQVKAAKR